jgi:hypothetical protein
MQPGSLPAIVPWVPARIWHEHRVYGQSSLHIVGLPANDAGLGGRERGEADGQAHLLRGDGRDRRGFRCGRRSISA